MNIESLKKLGLRRHKSRKRLASDKLLRELTTLKPDDIFSEAQQAEWASYAEATLRARRDAEGDADLMQLA